MSPRKKSAKNIESSGDVAPSPILSKNDSFENEIHAVTSKKSIPTTSKPKLPNEFLYPLGAELISEHLGGVPQFEQLRLTFWIGIYPAMEWRTKLLSGGKYDVLKARYESGNRFFETGWYVNVYPVKRGLKVFAHAALIAYGLPMLNAWLAQHNISGTFINYPACALVFNPVKKNIHLREHPGGIELYPDATQIEEAENQVLFLRHSTLHLRRRTA